MEPFSVQRVAVIVTVLFFSSLGIVAVLAGAFPLSEATVDFTFNRFLVLCYFILSGKEYNSMVVLFFSSLYDMRGLHVVM